MPCFRRAKLARGVALGLLLGLASCAARAPIDDDAHTVLTKIAVGSCSNQRVPIPTLRHAVAQRPDLFLYIGDNVYGDAISGDERLPELRESYDTLAHNADFQALRDAVPVLSVWDDHDYGLDDGGADFAAKDTSKQLFLDFWHVPPGDERRRHDGLY